VDIGDVPGWNAASVPTRLTSGRPWLVPRRPLSRYPEGTWGQGDTDGCRGLSAACRNRWQLAAGRRPTDSDTRSRRTADGRGTPLAPTPGIRPTSARPGIDRIPTGDRQRTRRVFHRAATDRHRGNPPLFRHSFARGTSGNAERAGFLSGEWPVSLLGVPWFLFYSLLQCELKKQDLRSPHGAGKTGRRGMPSAGRSGTLEASKTGAHRRTAGRRDDGVDLATFVPVPGPVPGKDRPLE